MNCDCDVIKSCIVKLKYFLHFVMLKWGVGVNRYGELLKHT